MTDPAALYRLLTWFSPSYPVSAYAYSHGLENAIDRRTIHDAATARCWVETALRHGSGQADLVFLKATHEAETEGEVQDIAEFAEAYQPTSEIARESFNQGAAFLQISRAAWPAAVPAIPEPCAYPVAVGMAGRAHGIPLKALMLAYAHAFASNLISAAVRLVPLGQAEGQKAIAALEPVIEACVERSLTMGLEDIGTCSLMIDIASMKHESQYSRIFRS